MPAEKESSSRLWRRESSTEERIFKDSQCSGRNGATVNENNCFLGKDCDLIGGGKGRHKRKSWKAKQLDVDQKKSLLLQSDVVGGLVSGTALRPHVDLPCETYAANVLEVVHGKGDDIIDIIQINKSKLQGLIPQGYMFGKVSILSVDLEIVMDDTEYSSITLSSQPYKPGHYSAELSLFKTETGRMRHRSTNNLKQMMAVEYLHWSKWNKQMMLDVSCSPTCTWEVHIESVIALREIVAVTGNSNMYPFFMTCEDLSSKIVGEFDLRSLSSLSCTNKKMNLYVINHFQRPDRPFCVRKDMDVVVVAMEYYKGLVDNRIKCDGTICRALNVQCHLCNKQEIKEGVSQVKELVDVLSSIVSLKKMWIIEPEELPSKKERRRYAHELGKDKGYWEELQFLMQHLKMIILNGGPDYDFWMKMVKIFAHRILMKYAEEGNIAKEVT